MDDGSREYTVGYRKPPVEHRFQKGLSGNPGGRPRRTKRLIDLFAEALSAQSEVAGTAGARRTQAEAIFAGLVAQAAGPDLRAKKLLFEVLIKLQRADICWPDDRLPEIGANAGTGGGAEVAAEPPPPGVPSPSPQPSPRPRGEGDCCRRHRR